ncbi:hypothetical protein [Streptomyces roseochromogenus]|uniref:Uncharacterized protein n=1 Tax=Streptomyces roseochromogenus subsp. oscitans DS 12.976 TaxID=1352936 RepID=V6KWJ9_STRRC|nr:hypothetical protein [Streptomyces roseochromogenus]EST36398.1 hypothetical protein M878_02115 [Streptomyces roseochromogenus subsp. oscitans DS 12.976]
MKKVLEAAGFVALVQGVLGLVQEFTHWQVGLVQRLSFFDGYDAVVSFILVMLACALFAAAEKLRH